MADPITGMRAGSAGLRLAGIVGVVAACAVGAADLALLYSPEGGYGTGSYDYLRHVPAWRLRLGYLLGVLALPFEIAGLWHVSRTLAPAGQRAALVFLVVGVYSVIMGTVYHAALGPLAAAVQARNAAPPDAAAALSELIASMSGYARPLSSIAGYGVIGISVLFSWAVVCGRTAYPRWMLLCSPLALALLVMLAGRVLPGVGNVLLPATFSIANAVWFALSTVIVERASAELAPCRPAA